MNLESGLDKSFERGLLGIRDDLRFLSVDPSAGISLGELASASWYVYSDPVT